MRQALTIRLTETESALWQIMAFSMQTLTTHELETIDGMKVKVRCTFALLLFLMFYRL